MDDASPVQLRLWPEVGAPLEDKVRRLALVPSSEASGAGKVRSKRYPEVAECAGEGRPGLCGHQECRYHLAHRSRSQHEPMPLRDCSLDVANEGPRTQDEVAALMGFTREWVRLIEQRALASLRSKQALREFYDDHQLAKRRRQRRARGRR